MNNTTKMELKTYSPEEAQRVLDHYNNDNRNKKPSTISLIASDLLEGRYLLNGETIKFASDGTLIDGQNRLYACVKAGVPLTTWVATGIDKKAFDTIDVGMPRTGGDILHTQHEKHAPVLAGTLTLLGIYEQGRLPNGTLSRNKLRPLLEANPTIRESVSRVADSELGRQKLASKAALSFIHYMTMKVDAVKAKEFFDRLEDGANLDPDNPILILRNKLIRNAADTKKMLPDDVFAVCLKAWDAFFNDRPMKQLTFNRKREQFPSIAGLDDLLGNVPAAA